MPTDLDTLLRRQKSRVQMTPGITERLTPEAIGTQPTFMASDSNGTLEDFQNQQQEAENAARFRGRNPTSQIMAPNQIQGLQGLQFGKGSITAPYQSQMNRINNIAQDSDLFRQLRAQADAAVQAGMSGGLGLPTGGGSDIASTIISAAQKQLGVPYSWGGGGSKGKSRGIGRGANTVGFDCSGLVQYAYARAGLKVPRVSYGQLSGKKYAVNSLRPGDLLGPRHGGHVAIYLGNGKIIEAPRTGLNVRIRSLGKNEMKSWWGVKIYK